MKIIHVVRSLAVMSLVLSLASARAATFYVATTGSDGNPGTAAQPFRTITYAYSRASAGTTISVAPGVYTDYTSGWGLHLGKSGTSASPITLISQVPGGAIIDGQNASDRNQAVYIDGNYNILQGFVIRNGPNGGISIWSSGNQLLRNEIHHNGSPASTSPNGRDGVYDNEGTSGNVYIGNYIHDNGRIGGSNLDHGLYLCGNNTLVLNNVVIRNDSSGLQIAGYSTIRNMKVYNNVFAWNGSDGIIIWMDMSGVDTRNNIIFQNAHYGIYFYAATGSGVVMDHNLIYGNGSDNYSPFNNGGSTVSYTLGTTLATDPKFANSGSSSFDAHLSTGSPAVGYGLNFSSTFTTDMAGSPRPPAGPWDVGVYISGKSDSTPPSVFITAPANNATVSGTINVTASASDNVGVSSLQFTLDGIALGKSLTSTPYATTLNTVTAANGKHSLSAVVSDAAGNQNTALPISITVNNPLPAISLTSPVNGSSYSAPANITLGANVTANGHAITQVRYYNGATLLGTATSGPYTLSWSGVLAAAYNVSATAVYDSGSTVTSSVAAVSVTNLTQSLGLIFAATAGAISAPFYVANNNAIAQPALTTLAASGQAIYTFNVLTPGNYVVSALVNAPSTDANSFFLNVDAQPTDPTMIWDVPLTTGSASRTVSWRGNGVVSSANSSGLTAQFAPKVFNLSAGTHRLIIRGREGNVQLGQITIAPTTLPAN
jgi:hypothetical protein